MKKLSTLSFIALALVIIGGLNWGLVGIFDLDLVSVLFGTMPVIASIVYILIGLSAIYLSFVYFIGKE